MKQIVMFFLFLTGLTAFADQFTDELTDACYMGDMAIVRDLIARGADINAEDSYGSTPLASAANSGHLEIYELLIEKGVTYDLFDCSAAGDVQRVKELIAGGVDVNTRNKFGSTALMFASQDSGLEVMKILLDKGADLDIQNNQGRTALMTAAKSGQREAVILLLDHNADLHIRDKDDNNALKWAKWHRVVDRAAARDIEDVLTKAGAKE